MQYWKCRFHVSNVVPIVEQGPRWLCPCNCYAHLDSCTWYAVKFHRQVNCTEYIFSDGTQLIPDILTYPMCLLWDVNWAASITHPFFGKMISRYIKGILSQWIRSSKFSMHAAKFCTGWKNHAGQRWNINQTFIVYFDVLLWCRHSMEKLSLLHALFRVIHQYISLTRGQWCGAFMFLCCHFYQTVEQTIDFPLI